VTQLLSIRFPAALALVLGTLLAGCGLSDPYTNQAYVNIRTSTTIGVTSMSSTSTDVDPDPAPERDGTISQKAQKSQDTPAAGAGSPSVQTALARYAIRYINWNAATVGSAEKRLAAISVGQARVQALQAAAAYGHDSTLLQSRVANSGTVIAIAAGEGPEAGSWVIVTRETTTGSGEYAGLPPTDHITYAQVQHTNSGWLVSSWSPQL
jgi:hypothetical protein